MKHSYRCSWCENEFQTQDSFGQQDPCTCPACGMDAYPIRAITFTLQENEKSDDLLRVEKRASAAI